MNIGLISEVKMSSRSSLTTDRRYAMFSFLSLSLGAHTSGARLAGESSHLGKCCPQTERNTPSSPDAKKYIQCHGIHNVHSTFHYVNTQKCMHTIQRSVHIHTYMFLQCTYYMY